MRLPLYYSGVTKIEELIIIINFVSVPKEPHSRQSCLRKPVVVQPLCHSTQPIHIATCCANFS
jgi:hypothetical protein